MHDIPWQMKNEECPNCANQNDNQAVFFMLAANSFLAVSLHNAD